MSAEDLEKYETEMELSLYREYKDIVGQFSYVVETERRFYLANSVEVVPRNAEGEVYFDLRLADAWVWDMYRPARFVKQATGTERLTGCAPHRSAGSNSHPKWITPSGA